MCTILKEELESLDREFENVHGDVHRAHMNLQDKESCL
jgi:hypothetical protein